MNNGFKPEEIKMDLFEEIGETLGCDYISDIRMGAVAGRAPRNCHEESDRLSRAGAGRYILLSVRQEYVRSEKKRYNSFSEKRILKAVRKIQNAQTVK